MLKLNPKFNYEKTFYTFAKKKNKFGKWVVIKLNTYNHLGLL